MPAETLRAWRKPPPALAYHPDAVYVSLVQCEAGDNPSFWQGAQRRLWEDPAHGTVPIGWSAQAATADLMPDVFAWFSSHAKPTDYLYQSQSGIGYAYPLLGFGTRFTDPSAVWAGFLRQTRAYMERLGFDAVHVYTTPWTSYDQQRGNDMLSSYADAIPGLSLIFPDFGRCEGIVESNANYLLPSGIPVFHARTRWDFPMQNRGWAAGVEAVDYLVREVVEQAPAEGGGFMQVMALSWNYTPTLLQHAAERFPERFVLVRPDQLADLFAQSRAAR